MVKNVEFQTVIIMIDYIGITNADIILNTCI